MAATGDTETHGASPKAGYPTVTYTVGKDTVNPLRKYAYDPDGHEVPLANAFNVRQSARWKGYNGYWKTRLSLKESGVRIIRAYTPKFNLSYHVTQGQINLTDIRRRGMYGY